MTRLKFKTTLLFAAIALSSCKSEDRVFLIPKSNPLYKPEFAAAGDAYYNLADKGLTNNLLIVGALDRQIEPCHCFMRPNGGLKRLAKALGTQKYLISGSLTGETFAGNEYQGSNWSPENNQKISDFLTKHPPIAAALSFDDLSFWKNYLQKNTLSMGLVLSNFELTSSIPKLNLVTHFDYQVGNQQVRFLNLADKTNLPDEYKNTLKENWSLLDSALKSTSPDTILIVATSNLGLKSKIEEILATKHVGLKKAIILDPSHLHTGVASAHSNGHILLNLERRAKSLAVIKIPQFEKEVTQKNSVLLDIGALEYLADIWKRTAQLAVDESKAKNNLKETSAGFEVPASYKENFIWMDYSIPQSKGPFFPIRIDSVTLTADFD